MRRRPSHPKTIFACIAIALAFLGVAMGPFARAREGRSATTVIAETPRSVVETAFATMGASLVDNPVAQPQVQGQCADFPVSFLNPTCSKVYKRRAGRRHRVATFVVGRPNGSAESPAARIEKAQINQTKTAVSKVNPLGRQRLN
jgi:hypothetical protein